MIKIFRQIRQTLVISGNSVKYLKYAIGEIILVVIGILIALQINNWNQERLDDKMEQVLLNQWLQDFEANTENIKATEIQYQDLLSKIDVVFRYTGPKVQIPQDKKILDSMFSLRNVNLELVYGSLNFSSQQMERVKNQKLKIGLSLFPGMEAHYRELQNQVSNRTLEQRDIIKRHISLISRYPEYKDHAFTSDTLGWLRDRDFQDITVSKKWLILGAMNALTDLNHQNQKLIDLIKKDLNSQTHD